MHGKWKSKQYRMYNDKFVKPIILTDYSKISERSETLLVIIPYPEVLLFILNNDKDNNQLDIAY